MRSSARGRPPSESTEPASVTMPSPMNSRTTLLTEAVLRPVAQLRSRRLQGCPMNSDHSSTERLSLRRSRTVDRLRSVTFPFHPHYYFYFFFRFLLAPLRSCTQC